MILTADDGARGQGALAALARDDLDDVGPSPRPRRELRRGRRRLQLPARRAARVARVEPPAAAGRRRGTPPGAGSPVPRLGRGAPTGSRSPGPTRTSSAPRTSASPSCSTPRGVATGIARELDRPRDPDHALPRAHVAQRLSRPLALSTRRGAGRPPSAAAAVVDLHRGGGGSRARPPDPAAGGGRGRSRLTERHAGNVRNRGADRPARRRERAARPAPQLRLGASRACIVVGADARVGRPQRRLRRGHLVLGGAGPARAARGVSCSRAGCARFGCRARQRSPSRRSRCTWPGRICRSAGPRRPATRWPAANRALLYLLVFATMLVLPWTVRGRADRAAGVRGRGGRDRRSCCCCASPRRDHVDALVIDGRLAAPTGYFNSTAALFTIQALVAIALAARRGASRDCSAAR